MQTSPQATRMFYRRRMVMSNRTIDRKCTLRKSGKERQFLTSFDLGDHNTKTFQFDRCNRWRDRCRVTLSPAMTILVFDSSAGKILNLHGLSRGAFLLRNRRNKAHAEKLAGQGTHHARQIMRTYLSENIIAISNATCMYTHIYFCLFPVYLRWGSTWIWVKFEEF